MRKALVLLLIVLASGLYAADELYLNGLNEVNYTYRTAEDSLNSYFRNAFSFSLGYQDFTLGMKFLAELPKYSTNQNQLLGELNPNKLSTKWTERYLEFERDNLLLHGGTISESFGSGMVFRAWEDLEFDTDTRLDGFLAKYDRKIKLKGLYGALPNLTQPLKNDLAYGVDAEYPVLDGLTLGASVLTLRTLNALSIYNQQDVWAGRLGLNADALDWGVEYARTSLFNNSGADHEGTAVNANFNIYLKPEIIKSLTLGAGMKHYDNFQYRTQDLKTFNYHNETLADNLATGIDEEGLQWSVSSALTDNLNCELNYAEAWNSGFSKRMNDFYSGLELHYEDVTWLLEYGHVEKLDKAADHWQKELKPAISMSRSLNEKSLTLKLECDYTKKTTSQLSNFYVQPLVQADLGLGKLGISVSCQSRWDDRLKWDDDWSQNLDIDEDNDPEDELWYVDFFGDLFSSIPTKAPYWANLELKYALFDHTDLTFFVGREAGGKVCRNGICRYVAPFQGLRLEASTRF
jgi:hypothetical protein